MLKLSTTKYVAGPTATGCCSAGGAVTLALPDREGAPDESAISSSSSSSSSSSARSESDSSLSANELSLSAIVRSCCCDSGRELLPDCAAALRLDSSLRVTMSLTLSVMRSK